jgi:hypothetical protein
MLSAPSGAIGDFAKANLQDYPRTYRTIQDWPIENRLVKRTILAAGSTFSGHRSAFTDGRFSAYPLPGRTFLLKAGATF